MLLRAKLEKLNAILGKYPLPQKMHRDLIIIAMFDQVVVGEANTYDVILANEWATIAILDFNPRHCHKAFIIETTYFIKLPDVSKGKYNYLPKDDAVLINLEQQGMSRKAVAAKYGVTHQSVIRRYSEIRRKRS